MHPFAIKRIILWALVGTACGYTTFLRGDPPSDSSMRITIVGERSDHGAQVLYDTAKKHEREGANVTWQIPSDEKRIKEEIVYPTYPYGAAYVCVKMKCSLAQKTAEQLENTINAMLKSNNHYDQAQ